MRSGLGSVPAGQALRSNAGHRAHRRWIDQVHLAHPLLQLRQLRQPNLTAWWQHRGPAVPHHLDANERGGGHADWKVERAQLLGGEGAWRLRPEEEAQPLVVQEVPQTPQGQERALQNTSPAPRPAVDGHLGHRSEDGREHSAVLGDLAVVVRPPRDAKEHDDVVHSQGHAHDVAAETRSCRRLFRSVGLLPCLPRRRRRSLALRCRFGHGIERVVLVVALARGEDSLSIRIHVRD